MFSIERVFCSLLLNTWIVRHYCVHILYIAVLGRSELQQFAVYALHRQAHHIEIASAETGHADVANPLLYAIGSGLVERTAGGYIVVYLLVGKCLERYIGRHGKAALPVGCGKADTCDHAVGLAAQLVQHAAGFGLVGGLA